MPTLEPIREGFTQSGSPSSRRSARASPRSPTATKSTCGIAAGRRTAASGSACPCRSPRRARRSRRRGRRAISSRPWTLPSSPKGPCRTGKTTSAPSRPPPGIELDRRAARRSSARRGRSSPRPPRARLPRARAHRGARAQRDVVLGGAAAAEDRDPHGRPSSLASGSLLPAPRRACRRSSVTFAPGFSSVPGGRELVDHPADLALRLRSLLLRPPGSGRRRAPLPPLRDARACRSRSAPSPLPPEETTIARSSPVRPRWPALGDWLEHLARRAVRFPLRRLRG